MRITVSGLPGSGTTSLARHLASTHSFELISAGEVFRQMAGEHGMDLAQFGQLAEKDPSIDRMIDSRQKDMADKKDNIIIEGRLSGWFVPGADLKVWLSAATGCRVSRILARDFLSDVETATHLTLEREACEALRYKTYYNIDISDLSLYHLVLSSEHWGVEELAAIVSCAIRLGADRQSCAH